MRRSPATVGSSIGRARAGALLFGAAIAWVVVAGVAAGANPIPMAISILLSGLVLVTSWAMSIRWPIPVLVTLVVGALLFIAADPAGVFEGGADQPPLGYANATAAFYGMATIATVLLLVLVQKPLARAALVLAGLTFVVIVVVSRSWAAAILLATFLAVATAVARAYGSRAAVTACAVMFVVALCSTQVIGATRLGTGDSFLDQAIRGTLSAERAMLWREAIDITARQPWVGVGPGRFAQTSSIARSDPDLGWVHHEFLQASAETGILGYVLLVALFAWGFATLWVTASGLLTAIAAAGLGIVSVHATLDYVLHFPAVLVAVSIVVGTGIGSQPGRRPASIPVEVSA